MKLQQSISYKLNKNEIGKEFKALITGKSKGDYLSLSIGKAVALAGDQVDLPLYISNNSVDNRGFCGFQAKIKYDPNNLTLNTISNSSFNLWINVATLSLFKIFLSLLWLAGRK